MKKFSTLLFLLLFHFCFSQNLVTNWSFEDTVTCPTSYAEMSDAVGWSDYRGTPDYFNSCNNSIVGVPQNIYGYQYAKTGDAYAGFIAIFGNVNGREFLGTQLNQMLFIGQKYFVSFYVSRVANDDLGYDMAINRIGAKFSTVPFSSNNWEPIDNHAQIYTDSIITDTLNWTKISGSFIADSTYHYLSIGNFFTDSATTQVSYNSSQGSYYFVDDIKVSTDSNYVNAVSEYGHSDFVTIFPNPARDWISIRGNDVRSLMLYDALGRIFYSIDSAFISPTRINTSSFPRGVYFLKIQTEAKSIGETIILQ